MNSFGQFEVTNAHKTFFQYIIIILIKNLKITEMFCSFMNKSIQLSILRTYYESEIERFIGFFKIQPQSIILAKNDYFK